MIFGESMGNRFIIWALLFLIVYIPLEDFLLKILPVPGAVYIILRQGSEVIIYFLTALVIYYSLLFKEKITFIKGRHNLFLLVFCVYAILIAFFSESSFMAGIKNLKAMVRYILLIYLIVATINYSKFPILAIKCIFYSSLFQVFIGFLQILGGTPVKKFFAPKELEKTDTDLITGFSTLDKLEVDIFGTISTTIGYGFFLIVGLSLLLVLKEKLIKSRSIRYLIYTSFLICIYYCGSRVALLGAIIPIFHQLYKWDKKKSIFLIGFGSIFTLLYGFYVADPGSSNVSFWFIFSEGFVGKLELQRLGLLLFVFVPFLSDRHLLFGLGPDKDYLVGYANSNFDIPFFFPDFYLYSIKDVYWFSLIIFYGVIGFLFFIAFYFEILVGLLKRYKVSKSILNGTALVAIYLGLIMIPLNLFNQALEIRQISFYYWFLVAIVFSYTSPGSYISKSEKL